MREIIHYELTTKIVLSMLTGVLVGLVINLYGFNEHIIIKLYLLEGIFPLVGDLFVMLLKMLVVPLVFFSLLAGVIAIGNINMLKRIGIKAFLLYIFTTAMAIITALLLATWIAPGDTHVNQHLYDHPITSFSTAPNLAEILKGVVPENIILSFSQGEMLAIIFFAVFFAGAYLSLNQRNPTMESSIETINQTIMKMVYIVTRLAPFAVFALIAKPIAELGIDHLMNLYQYILVLIAALSIHLFVSLMILLKLSTGLSPRIFLSKIRQTELFAFATASSNATMPSTLQTLREKMGVENSVASFTVPFGATINMDGTAMMQVVATIFIANVYEVHLEMQHYLMIIGMSLLASIGTAGVPSAAPIMLSMVFVKLGLPPEGIALLLSVDRILDMLRTMVNVTGDAVVTCIIAKQEGELNEQIFYNPRAGLPKRDLTERETQQALEAMIKSGKYTLEIDQEGKEGVIRLKE